MSTLTLQSLLVQGFRSFEHLSIDRLGRVNLFVGKNSVGKTSLLEALWLYADRGGIRRLGEILSMRDEVGSGGLKYADVIYSVRYLFHGRPGNNDVGKTSAIIGEADSRNQLHLALSYPEGLVGTQVQEEQSVNEPVSVYADPVLTVSFGIGPPRVIPSKALDDVLSNSIRYVSGIGALPCSIITPNGLNRPQVGHLWDKVALTDQEDVVLSALRIVVPDLERISIVNNFYSGSGANNQRIPIVKLKGESEPVPLRSLGEGMNRLFGLALSLVNAAGGLFLADEIESGLHYSVQVDLWRIIFAVARQLDIQVFATTHSFDCIEAFQVAAQEDEASEGMLIRLERKNGEIVPTLFDERRLGIVTREHIEVR